MAPFFAEHREVVLDGDARSAAACPIDRDAVRARARQALHDPEETNDWGITIDVDLAASREAAGPVLTLVSIGR
jgi:hypothetical protein